MLISNSPLARRATLAALILAGPGAKATIAFRQATPVMEAGSRCEVSASRTDETPSVDVQRWTFSVLEAGGGAFGMTDGRVYYLAPEVEEPTTFHLHVRDNCRLGDDHPNEVVSALEVLPRKVTLGRAPANGSRANRRLTDTFMVKVYTLPDPVAQATEVAARGPFLFAGGHEPGSQSPINGLSALRFEPAPAGAGGPASQGHAFAGDDHGLMMLDPNGTITRLELPGQHPVRAVAFPPELSKERSEVRLLFACEVDARHWSPFASATLAGRPANLICVADAALSRCWPIAGSCMEDVNMRPFADGDGSEAVFSEITGLAVTEAGEVLVADAGNHLVRFIDPHGRVSTLAGQIDRTACVQMPLQPRNPGEMKAQDGTGEHARFGWIRSMVLDRDQEALYVADGHSIRRVSLNGAVDTILGHPEISQGIGPASGQPMAPGTPCLNEPSDLQILDGHLIISDQGNQAIHAFNLETRVLTTLAAPKGAAGASLLALPLEAGPQPTRSSLLAVDPMGRCLLGLGQSVFRFDLGAIPGAEAGTHAKWLPNLSPLPSPMPSPMPSPRTSPRS